MQGGDVMPKKVVSAAMKITSFDNIWSYCIIKILEHNQVEI